MRHFKFLPSIEPEVGEDDTAQTIAAWPIGLPLQEFYQTRYLTGQCVLGAFISLVIKCLLLHKCYLSLLCFSPGNCCLSEMLDRCLCCYLRCLRTALYWCWRRLLHWFVIAGGVTSGCWQNQHIPELIGAAHQPDLAHLPEYIVQETACALVACLVAPIIAVSFAYCIEQRRHVFVRDVQAAIAIRRGPCAACNLLTNSLTEQHGDLIIGAIGSQCGDRSRRHATGTYHAGIVAMNIEQPAEGLQQLVGDGIGMGQQRAEGRRIIEFEEGRTKQQRAPCSH